MCICSLLHLCAVYFDLFVYEVTNSPGFLFDPEAFHLLLEGFIQRRLEGKCEWINVVWEIAHGGREGLGGGADAVVGCRWSSYLFS